LGSSEEQRHRHFTCRPLRPCCRCCCLCLAVAAAAAVAVAAAAFYIYVVEMCLIMPHSLLPSLLVIRYLILSRGRFLIQLELIPTSVHDANMLVTTCPFNNVGTLSNMVWVQCRHDIVCRVIWTLFSTRKMPTYSAKIIVRIVLMNLIVCYGLPLSMMDAISATIFGGGQAIRQKQE